MSNATAFDTPVREPAAQATAVAERIAMDYVERWTSSCREFLGWHRAHFLDQEPSPAVLQTSEKVHPWMIRTTRLILGQMLDPDFPHPALARQIEVTLWQLQEAWEQVHNPMTESEADAILAEVFPGNES